MLHRNVEYEILSHSKINQIGGYIVKGFISELLKDYLVIDKCKLYNIHS